ncbi:hypothetical protein [Novosphingobium barchaimii]|uniref:hypothetical protein n=1 Tax=Novosphingobium barchaimii TaxID=1420591 RepID=UPI00146FD08B|nr:hypothetical protein [Novosphingobium barchaimii]
MFVELKRISQQYGLTSRLAEITPPFVAFASPEIAAPRILALAESYRARIGLPARLRITGLRMTGM